MRSPLNKDTQKTIPIPYTFRSKDGFTIVELLIVVVVIAILAAITIVSYNGITNRALQATMQSDLQSSATILVSDNSMNGSYPETAEAANGGRGLPESGDNVVAYTREGSDYCVTVTNPKTPQVYYLSSLNGQIQSGSCTDAGNNWIARAAPAANQWSKIGYGNGIFVLAAHGSLSVPEAPAVASTSPNGATWSTPLAIGSGPATDPTPIYAGGRFVTVFDTGRIQSAASDDGKIWQHATSAGPIFSYRGASVAYGAGTYVATVATPPSSYTYVYTSTDGINWTLRSTPIAWNGWPAVTYGNGKFVSVANSGTNQAMVSTDGINWTLSGATPSGSWSSITFGNGKFVAVASSGTNRIMTSTDGITWTAQSAPEANSWRSVVYGNGKFVAVANSGTNRVMTSPDGVTWTARAAAEANSWNSVAYGGGCFVAVATTGTNRVMTSCW